MTRCVGPTAFVCNPDALLTFTTGLDPDGDPGDTCLPFVQGIGGGHHLSTDAILMLVEGLAL